MNWLEIKYIHLLGGQLAHFKKKKPTLFNFRCPICSDSKKNTRKARGYFYEQQDGTAWFHCFNCGKNYSLPVLLKIVDPALYEQFVFERFKEPVESVSVSSGTTLPQKQTPVSNPFQGLQRISQLKDAHPGRLYLNARQIPAEFYLGMYYCPRFKNFVNGLIRDKYTNTDQEESRILIPLLTSNGDVIGFQGRLVGETSGLRYITIIIDETLPKIYGLEHIDLNRKYFVTEGPFDSMFLDNAIAVCGSDVISTLEQIDADQKLAMIVYDNEPRNPEIVAKMEKAIEKGWRICVWPQHVTFKDINDGVLGGLSPSEIMHIIETNTCQGLEAKLAITNWRRL